MMLVLFNVLSATSFTLLKFPKVKGDSSKSTLSSPGVNGFFCSFTMKDLLSPAGEVCTPLKINPSPSWGGLSMTQLNFSSSVGLPITSSKDVPLFVGSPVAPRLNVQYL